MAKCNVTISLYHDFNRALPFGHRLPLILVRDHYEKTVNIRAEYQTSK